MNEFEENKKSSNNNNGLLLSLVGVLTLIVAIAGATYAFFQVTETASGIEGSAASAGLTLTITPKLPATDGNLVPQYGSAINSAVGAGCNDGANVVCQTYEIKVTNTGNTEVTLNGTISFGGISSMPNLKYSTSATATSGFATSGTTASTTATALESNLSLAGGASSTIYIAVWIEETGSAQTDSGTFTATVTYNATNGKGVTSTITS